MKRSRCSEEQIVGISKEFHERMSAADLCRKYGIFQSRLLKRDTGSFP